jgi:hypothetical protein
MLWRKLTFSAIIDTVLTTFYKLFWIHKRYIYFRRFNHVLIYLLHESEFFLRSSPVLSVSRNSPYFMEHEGSLPHSQVHSTCPCLEPARSIPCPTSYFLKIHLNTKIPSTPGSSQWYHSLRFPRINPVYASPLPHTCYMPSRSHSSRFDHSNNILGE